MAYLDGCLMFAYLSDIMYSDKCETLVDENQNYFLAGQQI